MTTSPALVRLVAFVFAAAFTAGWAQAAQATTGIALVRHAPSVNGTIDGTVHQMLPEGGTLNGGAVITGDLLVPGMPTVRLNGQPVYAGTLDGAGAAAPSNYQITLNGNARLRHVVRRTNAVTIPSVAAVPAPTGTRTVTISSAGGSAGNFATLRHLTLNGGLGQFAVPPGTYGDFTANGGSGLTLGVAGATQPSIYNFQRLTLNGQTQVQIIGPVIINVANGFAANGTLGTAANPSWLTLNVYSGGFTLNGGCNVYGYVNAPNGTVIINGNSQLIGGVTCDRLTVNGGGLLRLQVAQPTNQPPVANAQSLTIPEDTAAAVTLSGSDPDGQTLGFVIVTPPQHGALTGTAPNFTYTPAANYAGADSFTFKVNDGHVDSATATVNITVLPINDLPVADAKTIPPFDEDTSIAVTFSGSDVEGTALTFAITTNPQHGTLSGTGDNRIYTPAPNYFGPDQFSYVAQDDGGASAPVVVSLTILPVNDAPVANSVTATGNDVAPIAITLSATDIEGDALTFVRVTEPEVGVLTGNGANLSYQAPTNFSGVATFTYQANDGAAGSNIATVTIAVSNPNDPPVAHAQSVTTPEDTPRPVTLTASDPDGDSVTFQIITPPQHGTVSGPGANQTYKPAKDYYGPDSFTFRVNDGQFDSNVATITVNVTPVDDAPVASAQSLETAEDTPLAIILGGSDAENQPLTFIVVNEPQHGTLSGTGANRTYTPAANYHGTDSFTFKVNDGGIDSAVATVALTVTPQNDAPTPVAQSATTPEDTAITLTLVGNDPENAPLTFTITVPPQHGTYVLGGATFSYTPATDYHGPDSFSFKVSDGELDSLNAATVTLTVTPRNDAPVAADQSASLPENTTLQLTLGASDIDGDALTYTHTQPAHGTLSGTAPNLTYTPTANYSGPDTFTFRATDPSLAQSNVATVSITVIDVNQPPTAAAQSFTLDEDTTQTFTLDAADQDGDALTYTILTSPANGALGGFPSLGVTTAPTLTYTPTSNFNGTDSFTYRVTDNGSAPVEATVSFTVRPINDAPVANAQAPTTPEDTPLPIVLTGSDAEGSTLTFTVLTNPARGSLSGTAPNLVYTPNANAHGDDAFTFKVNDGTLDSTPATIAISVTPRNDAPVATNATIAVVEDTPTDLTLAATDADGDALAYTIVQPPEHGTLSGTGANRTYTPALNYTGPDSFTFKATDSVLADSNVATVNIAVGPQDDAPVVNAGVDQTITLPAFASLAGTVTDVDGPAATVAWSLVSGPANVEFEQPAALATRVAFTTAGNYTLRLTATSGTHTVSDEVVVLVNASDLVSRTYTSSADFGLGANTNVNTAIADQLQLNSDASAGHVLWVANSSKGTVVKINTRTGRVEGEYWISPSGQPKNPSRTTVDLRGAVWCTSRDGNSAVHIGSVESGLWIDKNGNGQPDTSLGLNDVRGWSNAGGADTNGGVSTAEDECIIHYVKVSSGGSRHLSVDKNNNIWVSGISGPMARTFDQIDGVTGAILRTSGPVGHGGYGGLIDRAGVIWSTTSGSVLRWDTAFPLSGPNGDNWSTMAGGSQYGLALAPDGYIWASTLGGGVVYKYAPDGRLVGTYNQGAGNAQGLVVDRRGHVWVAHSLFNSTVGHLSPDGTWLGNIPVGSGPTGVAVDADGKIWSTNHNDGTVSRIDPNAGPVGADGVTPRGAVDFTSPPLGGNLYNYSDMTGSNLVAPPLTGVWTVVFDSNKTGTAWGSINWHAKIYDDSKLAVTVASSVDGVAFSPWRVGVRGQDLDVPNGRYLKVNVLMQRSISGHSPVLYDLTVGEQGYLPDYPFNTAPVIEAEAFQGANVGRDYKLQARVADDGLPHPSALTYHWEKISGPGAVGFDNANRADATATFAVNGDYVLRLTATDGALTRSFDVSIVSNLPPTANAGPDLGLREPGTLSFQGAVFDDGVSKAGLVTSWEQVAGPDAAVITTPASPTSNVTLPSLGRYVFKLNADDGWGIPSSDTMQVRVGPPSPAIVPTDIAAWWPFDGSTADVIHGHLAQFKKGAAFAGGKAAQGVAFDGGGSIATVAAHGDIDVGASAAGFTIEFWLKPAELRDGMVMSWGASNVVGLALYQYDGGRSLEVNFRERATSADRGLRTGHIFTAGQWTHIAVTQDRATGEMRIYVNGAINTSAFFGGFAIRSQHNLAFGAQAWDGGWPWKGTLDEPTLYNRPLSYAEVNEIYALGATGKVSPGNNTPPAINAGADVATVGSTAALAGTVVDDGIPAGAPLTVRWSVVSAPTGGTVSFANHASAATTATFSAAGTYLLRLDADDTVWAGHPDFTEVRVGTTTLEAPAGIAAWWPGNGHTREVINGNAPVELLNGATYASGNTLQGFVFDGSNDYGRTPAHVDTDVGTSASGFTVEFWVKPTELRDGMIMSWGQPNAAGLAIYQYDGGRSVEVNFRERPTATDHGLRSGHFIVPGQWSHVAVTQDRVTGESRIYINGTIHASAFFGGFAVRTQFPLIFGRVAWDGSWNWKGTLDEVALYKRPLAAAEIVALYNAGTAGKSPPDDNLAPVVNAGPDVVLASTANSAALAGSVVDDSKPIVAPTLQWSVLSAPAGGTVLFADPTLAATSATFTAAGTYLLQLRAYDGLLVSTDLAEVRVGVATVEAAAGISAWWPANSHPREVINGNAPVELFNGAGYAPGKSVQGILFDGVNDYARAIAHDDVDVGTSASGFTVEFWMKPAEVRDGMILSWGQPNAAGLAIYQYDGGRTVEVNFRERPNAIDHGLRSGHFAAADQWAHVAVTQDRATGEARIYVNGTLHASAFFGVFAVRTQFPLVFGRVAWDGSWNWKGTLDEVTLYKRPLSVAEIVAIYNAGADGKSPPDDNQAPVVNAGPDVAVASPGAPAALAGVVTDDNKPLGAATLQWTVLSAPAGASVNFANPASAATTATFSAAGTYSLQLTANDGLLSSSDLTEVRVGITTVEPVAGISAWWPANSHSREVINGNAPLELFNGAAYVPGKVLQGIVFDGSNDFARTPTHSDVDVGTAAEGFTVEFWAKPTELRDGMMLSWGQPGAAGLAIYQYDGGRAVEVNLRERPNAIDHTLRTGNFLTAGQWVHIAITQDRSTGEVRIYANGSIRAANIVGVFAVRTQYALTLGRVAWDGSWNWKGVLDEVTLYKRPLSATEISAIYQAGVDGKSPPDDNQAPIVSAGRDIILAATSDTANLLGSVVDDNKPLATTLQWSVLSAPTGATVNFTNPAAATTSATFSAAGSYSLQLSAHDGLLVSTDLTEVRVGVTTVEPAAGISAWWPTNGHPREVINGNAHVELINGASYVPGKVLQGLRFDGSDDHARALAHPDIDVGLSAAGFTFEFWMTPPELRDGTILSWGQPGAAGLTMYQYDAGRALEVNFRERPNAIDHTLRTSNFLVAGQTYHVAVTQDRTTGEMRLYVNGTLRASSLMGVFAVRTQYGLSFGRNAWDGGSPWKGDLDEVTLYKRPLSPAEIAALFNGGAGKTPPITNAPPVVNAGSDTGAYVNAPVSLAGIVIDDGLPNPPALVTYQWTKVSGPGNVVFSTATALNTNATMDAAGSYTLRLSATDSELTGSDTIVVAVTTPPPTIALTSPTNNATLAADTTFTLAATAAANFSGGTIAKVEFFRGGSKLGEDTSAPYTFAVAGGVAAGSYNFTAVATDSAGITATSPAIAVTFVTYSGPPVADIIAPAEDGRLSQPTAITGVVAHPALAAWGVDYRLKTAEGAPEEAWITISTGNTFVGTPEIAGNPAVPGALGTFDPTNLINGIYELRLRMTDTGGSTLVAGPITVVVEGNMKIGAFTIAFEDVKVPLAGIPITVNRTYDSRDTRVGDFGPGWRIALNNIRVQKNRHMGRGWWQTEPSGLLEFQFFYLEPLRERIVTIIMPDGESHRFRAGALIKNRAGDPDNASFAVPVRQGKMRFYPLGDTTGTLEPLGDANQLFDQFWLTGVGDQDLYAGEYADIDAGEYNPTRFRLTTSDGTAFIVDEALGLLEMRDRNGNTLVLDRDANKRVIGVTSTQNAPDGPLASAITIHRDATGRVDYIRDMAGRDIDYLYDPQGRLSAVSDREDNTTQFRYENVSFPYYLTKIIDPRGVSALRSEFDPVTGKLLKQIDADGNETVFNRGIDATGRFEKVKDRLGHETTFYYDERGNVTLKIDPLGAQTSYTYWPDSDYVKFETDHYGNVTSKVYDARGNVTVQTIGASAGENPANPTTGYTTRTNFNSFSRATQITDADGRVQSFTYHATTNELLTQTLGVGSAAPSTTSYTYYEDGSVHTITDALGNLTTHTYHYGFSDAAHPGAVKQMTVTVTDPAGSAGSDQANAATSVLRTTRTLFDAQENKIAQIVSRTLANGASEDIVTRFRYDAENRLRATIMPDGQVTETRYASFGKEDKVLLWRSVPDYESGNESLARITRYSYDGRGNRTSVAYADGTTELSGYDLEDRKSWSQDRRGYRTFFSYDQIGRLRFTIYPDANDGIGGAAPTSSTDPRLAGNPRSEIQYDLIGRVRFEIDERGAKTEFTYEDGCGCALRRKQMIQHRAAGNLVTHYQYDKAGHLRFVTDPRGNTTETRYDEHNRVTRVVHPATDEHPVTETRTDYDRLGRRIAITDQAGQITRYRYDGLGRLVEVRQYLDAATATADADLALASAHALVVSARYAYDELGAQTAQIDALGRLTSYETDRMGRRTQRAMPKDASEASFLTETSQYDPWGNLWKRTDFAGKTTTFAYDELNRLKSKTADATHPSLGYSHAVARTEYDYDSNGMRSAARTFSANGTLLYAETTPHDERGRLDYKDTAAGRLDYSYHANGRLKDVVSSNPAGVNVGYRYDELNRLEHVDDVSTGLPTRTTSYAYNANGALEALTQPNGIVHTYGYDALNRLRSLVLSRGSLTLHDYDYQLHRDGRRRRIVEDARVVTYSYDELHRLTGESRVGDAQGNNGDVGYALDKVGNRLERASQLAAISPQSNQGYNARDWRDGHGYNANGSTTLGQLADSLLQGTDVYDFEDRLILRTRADGSTINVSYDADGHRFAKNKLGAAGQPLAATTWLIDTNNLTGYAQVLEERITAGANVTLRVYTYGSDLISQATSINGGAAVLHYFGYDGHGNTRELTDASGSITDRYDYDVFGTLVFRAGGTSNTYLYCGEQLDGDLGLYYLRARYFHADSGRFWSMDRFEGRRDDLASLHKYLYASADPLNQIDPSGYTSLSELQMVQNVQARLNKMAIPNVRVIGQKVVKKIVCITAQGVVREGPIHHIATNKNFKKGQQFSKKFKELFDEAGIDLNHWANKLGVPGHKGPHPEKYHEEILQLLTDGLTSVSVEGLAAEAAQELLQEALENALLKIAGRLCNSNDPLTKLIAP